jgi:DNA repair exonuclease SbcCD ATPase subunit
MKRLGEERQALGRRLEQFAEESAGAISAGLEEVQAGLAPPGRQGAEAEFQEKYRDDLAGEAKLLNEIRGMLQGFRALTAVFQEEFQRLKGRLDPESEESAVAEEARLEVEGATLRTRRRRLGLLAGLFLGAALLSGAVAAAALGAFRLPALPLPPVVGWWAAPLALVLLILSVLFWIRSRRRKREAAEVEGGVENLKTEIRQDTEERERLAGLLTISGPGEVVRMVKASEGVTGPRVVAERQAFLEAHRDLVNPDCQKEYRKALRTLAATEREMRARAGRESQRLERAVQDAEASVKKSRLDLDKVENEIHECESQAAKKEVLLGKNREIQGRSTEIRSAIELRRLSMELLEDTASSIRNRIGPALSRFMKEALPRLTRGRYRDIKVGSDLSLQVFTGEKSDFLDPAELSGGTHEALALALRLATSQVFIAARTRQAQFMFLDEPFKMMDEARAVEALEMLHELSSEIQQIFVVQPRFTPAQRAKFDWMVETAVELVELTVPVPSPLGPPEGTAAPSPLAPRKADEGAGAGPTGNRGGEGGSNHGDAGREDPLPGTNRAPVSSPSVPPKGPAVVSPLGSTQRKDGGPPEEVKGRALPLPRPHEP